MIIFTRLTDISNTLLVFTGLLAMLLATDVLITISYPSMHALLCFLDDQCGGIVTEDISWISLLFKKTNSLHMKLTSWRPTITMNVKK